MTRNGKLIARAKGQNHFNAKARGAKRMAKRTDGSSLFVDQRRMPLGRRLVEEAEVESDPGREAAAGSIAEAAGRNAGARTACKATA